MATLAKERYALLSDDAELGYDSDTVAGSVASLEKSLSSPRRRMSRRSSTPSQRETLGTGMLLTWVCWGVIVGFQFVIIVLLFLRLSKVDGRSGAPLGVVETGSDINGIFKTLSHEYTVLKPEVEKYMPNMTTNDNRMEVRRNWDLLMPLGSGSVAIPDWRNHPLLGEPISDDPLRTGPLYEASWTHALHCLYYSVDTYHQLIINGLTGEENPHHASHCFEYLRNSIVCNLDMTLEGAESTVRKEAGGGQAHVCRSREQAVSWIEARRVDDLQDIIGPTALP